MPLSLLTYFSRMACDGINISIEGDSHLSCSIMQMTGEIASTAVTPVNHSGKGKAVMQGMRRGPQGLLAADQLSRTSPESIIEER